ncbi:MAG: N-acetylneuraminate synthase family protein [Alphaproteobacteria bacterium]
MTEVVQIGDRLVGDGQPVYLIAEIGINHNGDIDLAKRLIDKAVEAGFDAVKFQKRTVEVVYTADELAKPRESPFGTTNGDLKRALEFGDKEYAEIDQYCREKQIQWFASPWDVGSIDFLEKYDPPCYKVASAMLTDDVLLKKLKETGRPILVSTGMSSSEEIDHAMDVLKEAPVVIFHCTSTYPSDDKELNLSVIAALRERHNVPIGYSGHEVGVMPSVMAVAAYAACTVERHITLNRAMFGSDQAASIEPHGMDQLVKYIRMWPTVKGDGVKRVYESEIPIRDKLRRVG